MQINDPVVVAELTACHERYESSLMANHAAELDSLFWDSPYAIRYGVTENLYGTEEIRLFRHTRPPINLARDVTRLEITTLGPSAGTVNLEFRRNMNGVERLGRQTQFWIKFAEDWKIVSAHVSLLPSPAVPTVLSVSPAWRGEVMEDLDRIGQIASFLMEFPLDQSVEAAPVFQP
jgi:hypothetical protein